jgi:hypothetical protein
MRRLCFSLALGLLSLGLFAGSASADDWHHGHHGHGYYPHRAYYPAPVVVYRQPVYPVYDVYRPYCEGPQVVYRDYYPPPSGFAFSNRNFSIWFGH